MTVAYTVPSSIECLSGFIKTRSINPLVPQKNNYPEIKSIILYRFKLDRNCEAHISKELDPKKAIVDTKSMLNVADGVKGDMISGFSTQAIKQDKAVIKKGSSTHQAQYISISGFLYAKLEKSFGSIERMKSFS